MRRICARSAASLQLLAQGAKACASLPPPQFVSTECTKPQSRLSWLLTVQRGEEDRNAEEVLEVLASGGDVLQVTPCQLTDMFEDAVRCPSFSLELLELMHKRLALHDDSFGGCRQRREYFKNQSLSLFLEKAALLRTSMVHEVDGGAAWKVVLCMDPVPVEDSMEANFLVDLNLVPEIVQFSQGDLFWVLSHGEAAFLGVTSLVRAPFGSTVGLVQMHTYAIRQASLEVGTYVIEPIPFIPLVMQRQFHALEALCSQEKDDSNFVQSCIFGDVLPSTGALPTLTTGATMLNTRQEFAVRSAINSPLTLIQGPPGTGKTVVAVAIVLEWLAQDDTTPILVATGTNSASELLERRLTEAGVVLSDRRRMILGKPQRDNAKPVFVETVFAASMPNTRILPRVLIDESAQITEAAALVALMQQCTHLVLIGDPRQLGPVSLRNSPILEDERESVFQNIHVRHFPILRFLNEQYRMDPRICEHPSRRFYAGILKHGVPLGEPLPDDYPLAPAFVTGVTDHPVAFVDTARLVGQEEQLVSNAGRTSIQNAFEAMLVLRVIQNLKEHGVAVHEISVLTCYHAQQDLLLKLLHPDLPQHLENRKTTFLKGRQVLPHPRIHTINSFQGCENTFVIFSAVRSNTAGSLGFAADSRKMCVMLTRARRGLVVIGDSDTLKAGEEWKAWLKSPKRHVYPDPKSFTLATSPPT